MSEPWGYKVTFVAYVPGKLHVAEMVAGELANAADRPQVDFAGASIEPVYHEPKEQVAS